ncbi:hypothetical protein FKM82_022010 [Ascaphus truei]
MGYFLASSWRAITCEEGLRHLAISSLQDTQMTYTVTRQTTIRINPWTIFLREIPAMHLNPRNLHPTSHLHLFPYYLWFSGEFSPYQGAFLHPYSYPQSRCNIQP